MRTLLLPGRSISFVRFARWDAWASQRRLALELPKTRLQRLPARIATRYLKFSPFSLCLVKFHLTRLGFSAKASKFHFRCSATSTSRRIYVRFGLTRHYLRSLLDWGLVFPGFHRPGSSFH